jgi:MinD-like ATPase involved in chromosome partitioning or flagellar assembly
VYQPPSLRLALGLGDQELEQRLRPAFDDAEDVVVVAQCLAADQLLQAVESRQVDAAVVAWSLHRLSDTVLEQLERPGLPIVLLVPDPAADRWRARRGPVLPLDAQPLAIRQALQTASRGGERVLHRPRSSPEPLVRKAADLPENRMPGIIAVAGGAGSPGRTTVAINLATALGTAAPTVLVEADLCAPALAAYLDRDPSRNVCTLAHAVRENPHAWDAALVDELQPLSHHCAMGVALCGPPKREMRASIAPAFLERLVAELSQRYRYIVLDVGPELLGMETAAANHRAALASAQQLLLVAGSDLVGLWHARTTLDQLERQLGIERQMVSLVLNRYDARHHHSRSEVEWHLGAPVVAVIPFDHHATQRAIAQQRPLVVDSASRASRPLLNLAERLHNGKLRLPDERTTGHTTASWWRRILSRRGGVGSNASTPEAQRLRAAMRSSRRSQAW